MTRRKQERTFDCPPGGWLLAALGAAALMAAGCSRQWYRKSADREVYGILQAKSRLVPGMPEQFTIERAGTGPLLPAPPSAAAEEGAATEPVTITLEQALAIAARNSRAYQSQKESLYLSALSLTGTRHNFQPRFFSTAGADYTETNMGESRRVSGDISTGVNWLLKTGTRLGATLTTSFSQFLKGDPNRAASSLFRLTISQPLLQGAGVAVTESLTQAERNVIYQIRSFVRYRRSFFVRVLSDYYRVLQSRQALENEQRNYERLVMLRERTEMLRDAGQIPPYQVDQIRQDEVAAADNIEVARQNYQARLDAFKITLGLPPETPLALDPSELERLSVPENITAEFTAEKAVEVALKNRLDLVTARDRLEDAKRQLKVAENALLPGLGLSASASTDTEGPSNPLNFRSERTDYSVGIDLDLPLDKLSERNQYRRALIEVDAQERAYAELRDQVVQEVRNSWRQYDRSRRSYAIRLASLRLAETRVDSTTELLNAGRATARDVLEAQSALVNAQNSVMQALVDYKVARLELARDMEILIVSEEGQLNEDFESIQ